MKLHETPEEDNLITDDTLNGRFVWYEFLVESGVRLADRVPAIRMIYSDGWRLLMHGGTIQVSPTS